MHFMAGNEQFTKGMLWWFVLKTKDGTVGYAPGAASEDNALTIEKEISPLLLGTKLSDPSNFVEDMVDKKGDAIWAAAGAVEVALLIFGGRQINVR